MSFFRPSPYKAKYNYKYITCWPGSTDTDHEDGDAESGLLQNMLERISSGEALLHPGYFPRARLAAHSRMSSLAIAIQGQNCWCGDA